MKNALDRDSLIFLKTLCDTQNLVNAANQLGLAPATASRLLGKLREAFGDELFTRSSGGLVPTWRMTELLPQVRTVLDDYERLLEVSAFDPKTLERAFHIGGVDHGVIFLAPAVARVASVAPGVVIEMSEITNDWPVQLRTGELDAVISPMESVPQGFHYLKLRERSCSSRLVCRPGHPLLARAAQRGGVTMEEALSYGFVEITWRPTNYFRLAKSREGEAFASRRVVVKTPYFMGAAKIVSESDLLLPLSNLMANWCFEQGFLAELPLIRDLKFVNDFEPKLIWHDRSHLDPAMQWLRGMILSAVRDEEKKEAERMMSRAAPAPKETTP